MTTTRKRMRLTLYTDPDVAPLIKRMDNQKISIFSELYYGYDIKNPLKVQLFHMIKDVKWLGKINGFENSRPNSKHSKVIGKPSKL